MAKEKTHKPGEVVPTSGIYVVVHKGHDKKDHEVTCVKGERFPPCSACPGKGNTFRLKREAKHEHVKHHKLFKESWEGAQQSD